MKDLIILGAGVHAEEMVEIVARVNERRATWNLLGYIVPEKSADQVGREINGLAVLGTPERAADLPAAHFVPSYGFHDRLDVGPDRLVSLIDPSAFVSRTARIGRGCVVYPNCFIGLNAVLGDRVFVLSGSVINHDDHLAEGVVICSNVSLAGFVHVEAGCYLGQACTVRQSIRIGKGSMIGMGGVVTKDVPPNSVMVGNPARKLKDMASPT